MNFDDKNFFFRNNMLMKESEAYCKRIIEKNEIEMER